MIARIHAELPAEATLATRKRALRASAWTFHQGTSWGKRVWSARSRAYLERHGAKPREPRDEPRLFAPDIIFPFRDGGIVSA